MWDLSVDGAPCLIALKAELVITSSKQQRRIPIEDFFIDYGKQDLKEDEVLEKIILPKKADDSLAKFYKLSKRFDQDISAVCAAFVLTFDSNNKIATARLAYGGMAATPKRAEQAEKMLVGQSWDKDNVQTAMQALDKDFTPLTDMRASAEYRQTTAKNLLYRFFIETTQPKVQTRVYNYAE